MGCAGSAPARVPAIETAGTYRAARPDLWEFDERHYGPLYREFQTEGFANFKLVISSADATTAWQYGNLCSGVGQLFKGATPGSFVGTSTMTAHRDPAMVGSKSTIASQDISDGTGETLIRVTITLVSGPAKGLILTEYNEPGEPIPVVTATVVDDGEVK